MGLFRTTEQSPLPIDCAAVDEGVLAFTKGEKVTRLLVVHLDTGSLPPAQGGELVRSRVALYAPLFDKLPTGFGVLIVPNRVGKNEVSLIDLT
jgi:hypothetical protein